MLSIWTFGFLFLCHTLGSPIFSNTRNGSHVEHFLETFRSSRNFSVLGVNDSRQRCPLPSCALVNLADSMQNGGDEKAGDKTQDAWGNGKK
ncbi:hypothetical protein DNTS_015111 [Danionella cerebrum]|uniref:Calcitonin peptide-like domain-containing protein n=1 Tax=Danionella cerebrum TaxID=2873325 RepID=A0A553PXF4_9TELE|nr:hypothetical protein DNTS_015111 [Danionella translucida]